MTFDSRSSIARMLIITPDETREKQFRSFARGQQDAYMVFEKPRRDAGTKVLKLEGNLWIYFPRTEKTVKISGHLLRQSMLGSDFSYEDMTENRRMLDDYDGDGNAELAIGEHLRDAPLVDSGRIWIVDIDSAGVPLSAFRIDGTSTNFTSIHGGSRTPTATSGSRTGE